MMYEYVETSNSVIEEILKSHSEHAKGRDAVKNALIMHTSRNPLEPDGIQPSSFLHELMSRVQYQFSGTSHPFFEVIIERLGETTSVRCFLLINPDKIYQ